MSLLYTMVYSYVADFTKDNVKNYSKNSYLCLLVNMCMLDNQNITNKDKWLKNVYIRQIRSNLFEKLTNVSILNYSLLGGDLGIIIFLKYLILKSTFYEKET